MIAPFQLLLPGRILFGRGEAAKTAGLAAGFGPRVLLVHGRDAARAAGDASARIPRHALVTHIAAVAVGACAAVGARRV